MVWANISKSYGDSVAKMKNTLASLLIKVMSLIGILVGIIITILMVLGIQSFQQLVSQNHPLGIGLILAMVVIVLAVAHKLGWAESWIPAKA